MKFTILFCSLFLFLAPTTWAQSIDQGAIYVSPEDDASTFRRIAVAPAKDNANNIYANPTYEKLKELVDMDHRYDLARGYKTTLTPDQLDDSPEQVKKTLQAANADALMTLVTLRTPDGMQYKLRMYRRSDGRLFLQKEVNNIKKYHLKALNQATREVYDKLIASMPYQGMILSRRGRDVTINIGTLNGVKVGDDITVVQLVGFNRHPKFDFVINSKKQLMGSLKVIKADERLSFAKIVSERAPGAIVVNTKVETREFIKYGEFESMLNEIPGLFGKNPKEWVPEKPPSFGRLMAGFGLGRYNGSLNGYYTDNSQNVTRNIDSKSSFVPSVNLEAEIWLNPQWIVKAGLGQSIVNTETDAGNHNIGTSRYSMDFGYNLLFTDSFFGPKMGVSLGFLNYQYNVDETGPDGITSLRFSGYGLGVNGSFPLAGRLNKYSVGGSFTTFLNASMKETPRTSGDTRDVKINSFDIFATYKMSERIRIQSLLRFELYSAKFSNQGTRNVDGNAIFGEAASNRYTTFGLNVNYLF